jgi:hypothetical protein
VKDNEFQAFSAHLSGVPIHDIERHPIGVERNVAGDLANGRVGVLVEPDRVSPEQVRGSVCARIVVGERG